MNIKNIASYIIGLTLTLAIYGLSYPADTEAQFLPLQVAPARQEITIDPGQSAAINVRFFNLAEFPSSGFIRAADFIVADAAGTPRILEDVDQTSPRFSAASWITLPFDRMSVAGNDKVSVQATINVPADARPGGRYVALYFEPGSSIPTSVTAPQEAGASVAQRIAALIYIRVNGPITEKALVSRIFAPTFLEYGPINVEADILNKGDYHISPKGSIALKNALNGFVDQKKLESVNIFPDSLRTYTDEIGTKWMFGKYTVELVAAYGSTGQVITRSIDVWVFPWKVALAVVLALIILYLGGKTLYRRLIIRENMLESEIKKEHEEIKKLREELKQKHS